MRADLVRALVFFAMNCDFSEHDARRIRELIMSWYAANARDLPWRKRECSPWGVLVSEIMLQQTPVARVEPYWFTWMKRWPTPKDLAAEESGEAIRAWGRLGYPRRALRLHATAVTITQQHDGVVPDSYDALRTLPGVGDYTAAAVASFAYGGRHVVLDTNVRRVLGRLLRGEQFPAAHVTTAERHMAANLLPEAKAPAWSVAIMELGALVCTARTPRCDACPVAQFCSWRVAGSPEHATRQRRTQLWKGTDRQARGQVLAALRDTESALSEKDLRSTWADAEQRERALKSLIADGLIEHSNHSYKLPA